MYKLFSSSDLNEKQSDGAKSHNVCVHIKVSKSGEDEQSCRNCRYTLVFIVTLNLIELKFY